MEIPFTPEKQSFISNKLKLQNHSSILVLTEKSKFSATSTLSGQPKPMAYKTTASLKKQTCTDYKGFRNYQGSC